ncbi:unnamed protein product [Prunus armeniaca]
MAYEHQLKTSTIRGRDFESTLKFPSIVKSSNRRQLERLLGGEAMMPSPQDPERFSYPIKEFQWSC